MTEQLGANHLQLSEDSLDVGEQLINVLMLLLFRMDVIIRMKDNQTLPYICASFTWCHIIAYLASY